MAAVPNDNLAAWDHHATQYQSYSRLSTDVAHYGPDIGTEADLHLLGDVRGKRVLELGCGGAQCSIAFAKQGATAIGIDFSSAQITYARRLAEREKAKVEFHQGDVADLAFLRADTIDLVFSAHTFGFVEDLRRVFRQTHRVLRVGAPLVFSLPHPAYAMIDDSTLGVRRSWFDHSPIDYERDGSAFTEYRHSIPELYGDLLRSGYRVDAIVEPEPLPSGPRSPHWRDAFRLVPHTLIIRARKEGV
ncbi:MAG: class I SAM-dependent methyltransferase [Candidatus Dormibacteria bacterium]